MKTFAKLSFLFLVTLQSTAVFANFQSPNKCGPKHYLATEKLIFSENGIYVFSNHGQTLPLNKIQFDSEGYFVAGFIESLFPKANVIASCKNCGAEYHNRSPQPCENCQESWGFDIVHIEDGYDS
ncbi:MAG: hypothetical protein P0S96_07665 [Simkaniaceae bacterium]|nr:hypothetical protein [Candidatus Sacchlamyda saccharinae]